MPKNNAIKGMSVTQIGDWIMERNFNYQTVAWCFLEDAIRTGIKESGATTLEDLYSYIHTNLL